MWSCVRFAGTSSGHSGDADRISGFFAVDLGDFSPPRRAIGSRSAAPHPVAPHPVMSRGEMGRFSLASAGTGTVRGEERWLARACNALPGWRAVDRYPERSPLAIADFLLPQVAGKRMCEIGTRNGDIMSCLMQMGARPSNATAIEMDGRYCRKLRKRGLNVICSKVENVARESLTAACDVYFWWPMVASQSSTWLSLVHAAHEADNPAEVYVAHDTHNANDIQQMPHLFHRYNGSSVHRVFFDEGGKLHGPASYTLTYWGRPGRWGVFHVVRFEVPARPRDPLLPTWDQFNAQIRARKAKNRPAGWQALFD